MCGERLPDRGRRTAPARAGLTRSEFGHSEAAHEEKWVEGPARAGANPAASLERSSVTRGPEPPLQRLPDDAARYEDGSERRGRYQPAEPAPSFLGLGNAEYERPQREISWRFWALMLLLLGVAALFGLQWRANQLRANQPGPKPAAAQPAEPNAPPAEEPAVKNDATEQPQAAPSGKEPAGQTAKPAGDQQTTPAEAQPKSESKTVEEPPSASNAATDQPKAKETRAATPREFSDAVVKQADSFIAAGQCNDALRALRGAGDNPKAMTKMGALYLTGTCVEPDRVTAYAWFSQAFAADPHNLRLESTRRMVWSQMTDEERARIESGYKAR